MVSEVESKTLFHMHRLPATHWVLGITFLSAFVLLVHVGTCVMAVNVLCAFCHNLPDGHQLTYNLIKVFGKKIALACPLVQLVL